MPTGLYIHVPFCTMRCHFCAFYLRVFREDKAQRYVAALRSEIRLHAERDTLRARELETVYFGGGTPTTLAPGHLARILEQIRDDFGVRSDAEVCIEAHPDTVTSEGLKALVSAGFNRISFGIQSSDDQELTMIGRPSDLFVPRTVVEQARHAGLTNINIDLMYGLPGQTMASWLRTVDEILELEPTHLSCYALTIEDRTRLNREVGRGRLAPPDEALQNAMEDAAAQRLSRQGYARYEISNYCRPGYASRHNLLHWTGADYLGLGPSGQSYVQGRRFGTIEDLEAYVSEIEAGRLPIADCEELSVAKQQREQVVCGLRLIAGIDRALVDTEGDSTLAASLERLLRQGLLEESSRRIRLSARGRRYADSVAAELIKD